MSRPTLTRTDRITQMSKQEELIAKKRQEILEKQKTTELAKAVAAAQSEVAGESPCNKPFQQFGNDLRPKVQNNFCNDGSFLTHFKKILESTKEKEKISEKVESDNDDKQQTKSETDNPDNVIITAKSSPTPSQNESNDASTDSFKSNHSGNLNNAPTSNSNLFIPQNTSLNSSLYHGSDSNSGNSVTHTSSEDNTQRNIQDISSPRLARKNYSEYNKSSEVRYNEQKNTITSICNVTIPPPNISAPLPPLPSSSSSSIQNDSLFHKQSLYYNPNIPPPVLTTSTPPPPPPPPCLPIYLIPPPEPLQLNNIPPPKELDLNAIPQPELNLDAIKIPNFENQVFSDNNEQFLPTTLETLIELVAEKGDAYEDKIRTRKNELHPSLWFLFNQDSPAYKDYRRQINSYRNQKFNENNMEKNESQKTKIERNSETNDEKYDPESVCDYQEDSDDEYMKDMKERNLGNLKKKLEEKSEQNEDSDDDDDYDDEYCSDEINSPTTETSFSSSQSISTLSAKALVTTTAKTQFEQEQNHQNRKRKSRWGEKVDTTSQVITAVVQTNFANQNKPMLSAIQRTDPALLQYARQNYGTTNLTEEDWRKCEDHFKVNLLYQDMMKKRREIDLLAKSGKFKYEYDSDEDTTGGTWEHKLRTAEMEATKAWADALTQQSEGKHHIGDFLPPEELKKFMEKYEAKKNNRQPDLSDYKEYKLKEDNIGFQMLQKLGWKEGQGLGASGEGIVDPINKAPQRDANQGLGAGSTSNPDDCDNEYDAYRKRMMLAYRFRPNPLNNPRRAYY